MKSNELFLLLDLVDRYWNGSKSLHQNPKFLSAANQLVLGTQNCDDLNQFQNDDLISNLQSQLRVLQDENKRLQNQLIQKSIIRSNENGESSIELQNKNLLAEIVSFFFLNSILIIKTKLNKNIPKKGYIKEETDNITRRE